MLSGMSTLDEAFDRLHDPDDWDAHLVVHLHQLRPQHGGPAVEVDGGDSLGLALSEPSRAT